MVEILIVFIISSFVVAAILSPLWVGSLIDLYRDSDTAKRNVRERDRKFALYLSSLEYLCDKVGITSRIEHLSLDECKDIIGRLNRIKKSLLHTECNDSKIAMRKALRHVIKELSKREKVVLELNRPRQYVPAKPVPTKDMINLSKENK